MWQISKIAEDAEVWKQKLDMKHNSEKTLKRTKNADILRSPEAKLVDIQNFEKT